VSYRTIPRPFRQNTLAWQPRRLKCDLSRPTAHSFGSLSPAAGADLKTISAEMGHSTIGVTANTYRRVMESLGRENADRLDNLLNAVNGSLTREADQILTNSDHCDETKRPINWANSGSANGNRTSPLFGEFGACALAHSQSRSLVRSSSAFCRDRRYTLRVRRSCA
jgi:hypothetical protein